MDAATLLGFFAISLFGIAMPGPDVLLAVRNGCRHGVAKAMVGIAAVALSDLFLMAAVAFGLGAILAASELFFIAVKCMGVVYLAYIGIKLLRVQAIVVDDAFADVGGQRDWQAQLFTRSFMVAFTNIKVWLFFAAFLPQFVDVAKPQIPQYTTLAVVFEAVNVAILTGYATLGASAVRLFKGNTALWMDRCSGILLLILAVGLMVY